MARLTSRAPFGAENTQKILMKNREAHVKFIKKHWQEKSFECMIIAFVVKK